MLYPHPQIYHHLKSIFVHVPKAAGTSIERQLRENPAQIVGGHTTALAYRRAFPSEFSAYYKFAFVRHPLDRFLSAYFYLKERPVHAALNNERVHALPTLRSFIEAVETSPEMILEIVHLIPQYTFVCDAEGNVLIDDVFRFEDLPDVWRLIARRLRLANSALRTTNASKRENVRLEDYSKTRAVVQELYAKDFDLFHYSRVETADFRELRRG